MSQVAAGWYPDPEVGGQLRWWDGTRWSEHVAPAQPLAGAAADLCAGSAATGVAHARDAATGSGQEAQVAADGSAHAPLVSARGTTQDPQHTTRTNGQQPFAQQPFVAASPAFTPVQKVKKPKASKIWNWGTWVTLGVCVALVIGALVVVPRAYALANAESDRQAEEVLKAFVAAGEKQDDSWRKYATPQFSARVLTGAPIGGEKNTAKALKMKVTTELDDLKLFANQWYSDTPPRSDQVDMGTANITISYEFTVGGKKQEAVVEQTVWMARPFYYGDKKPAMFDYTKQPTAIGPWRVFRLQNRQSDGVPPRWTTSMSEKKSNDTAFACGTGPDAYKNVSDYLRVDNKFYSDCLFGKNGVAFSDKLDRKDFAAHIPAIDPISGLGANAEITGIGDVYLGGKNTPIMEFPFKGAKGTYVVTFALVKQEEYGIATTEDVRAALIAVQPAADPKASSDAEKTK